MSEVIVLVECGHGIDRTDLEKISGDEFNSVGDLRNHLLKEEPNIPNSSILIFDTMEFMGMWYNQDDDTPSEERISIDDYWLGVVKISE